VAARKPTSVRLSDTGRAVIARLVTETGRPQSEVMRVLMSEALGDQTVMRRVRTRLGKAPE
jgi:hypothetical protein